MRNIEIKAQGKMLLMAIALLGCFGYAIAAQFTSADSHWALAIINGIVFYALGNGVGARKGESVVPLIGPKDEGTP